MRVRIGLEALQWIGLGAGAAVWAAQLVIGFGATVARCSAAGPGYGINLPAWEIALTATGAAFVLAAEAAAIRVVLRTRGTGYDGAPPDGRRRFFASAAIVGNLLFLGAILLSGLATLAFDPCRQA